MGLLPPRVMNFTYGMGAAVVIIGALFKIQHYPGAGPLLIIGLVTEAIIFGLSAFDAPEKEIDWCLVYRELAGGEANHRMVGIIERYSGRTANAGKLDRGDDDAGPAHPAASAAPAAAGTPD